MKNCDKLYINGAWVASASGEFIDVVNATTEEVAGRVPEGTEADANAAIAAAPLEVVKSQGFSPESVPPVGLKVLIRRNANLSTGGTAEDVTDLVHPDVAARSIEAAKCIGLDIAGIDIVAPSPIRSLILREPERETVACPKT